VEYRVDSVIWIFTSKCNLKCPHCYASIYEGVRELSLEEKLKLAREICEAGVEYVGLSGGEPLIHPHFKHIVSLLRDYGVSISIVTNATVVDDETASFLYRNDVLTYVSIDGPRDIHDLIRGDGVFEKMTKSVGKLRSRGVDLASVTAISRLNRDYVSWCVRESLKMGFEHAAIIPVMPSGRALDNKLYIDSETLVKTVLDACLESIRLEHPLCVWCVPFMEVILEGRVESGLITWFSCRRMESVDIDPAGNLITCDVLGDVVSSASKLGFEEAWRIYCEDRLIKEIVEPSKLPATCMSCRIRGYCKGGCYARAKIMRGGYNSGDPLCPLIASAGKGSLTEESSGSS